MTEQEPTEQEVEEAVRRLFADGAPTLQSDEVIQSALDDAVEQGLMEKDGDNYRLTDAGNAMAESVIKETLDAPPPRHDAETHLYTLLQSMTDEESALESAFSVGQFVLETEHHRLADRIAMFGDGWATDVADLLRRGVL